MLDKEGSRPQEPFASFHSLFESRQDGNGSDGRFNPSPTRLDFFDVLHPLESKGH